MKKDFSKLLVQRSRTRIAARVTRKTCKHPLLNIHDDLPFHEPIRGRDSHRYRKESHENRAPLKRFLQRRVGCHWDEVFSEISASASFDSVNGRKLFDGLTYDVDRNVRIVDGKLVGRWGYELYSGELYVHPSTGIVMRCEKPRKRWRQHNHFPWQTIVVDDAHRYLKIDGLWYFITLSPIPGEEVHERPFDLVLKETAWHTDRENRSGNKFFRFWDAAVYASGKRQAGKREMLRVFAEYAEQLEEAA